MIAHRLATIRHQTGRCRCGAITFPRGALSVIQDDRRHFADQMCVALPESYADAGLRKAGA